jgi:hypothetical protein
MSLELSNKYKVFSLSGTVQLRVGTWRQNRGCGPCCSQSCRDRPLRERTSHPLTAALCTFPLPSAQPPPAAKHDLDLSPPHQAKASAAKPAFADLFFPSPSLSHIQSPSSSAHRRASGFAIVIRSFVSIPAGSPPPKTPGPTDLLSSIHKTRSKTVWTTFLVRSYQDASS